MQGEKRICILTIVKNEHQYLDEWISYHLNMGVSHIYIFEDIDSDSHNMITQCYDNVSLFSVSTLLTDAELQQAVELKRTKKDNPQHLYLRKALLYIQSLHQYDWVFPIDVDEFITLESASETISSAMNRYSDYDAVLLQWKCYGANGYITKPNYALIDTFQAFTTPSAEHILCSPYPNAWSKRIVYNLHRYQNAFFHSVHQAKNVCNFCNTRFERDRESWCYDVIFLRHYITKSFEEYIWKKRTRGYFMGFSRTTNGFFVMSPELQELQEDLAYALTHPVLVVLPYIETKSQGCELRLALNGWRKNAKFRYHFVVIGEFNAALKNEFPWVEFIFAPTLPKVRQQYNPHLDIRNKFEIAYNLFKDKYPGFIYMVDDNYAIRPFNYFEIFQTHYLNDAFTGVKDAPTTYWKHDKWKTRQLLDAANLPHINYTTHFPCYFNFKKLQAIWNEFDMRNESYVPEDVYFNKYNVSKPLSVKSIRYGIWGPKQMGAPLETALADPNIKFLCNSVEGWSPELEQILSNLILEPNP